MNHPLIIESNETFFTTQILHPAIAASPQWIIHYQNKILLAFNQKESKKKIIPWDKRAGHVVDLCWYEEDKFIVVMKNEIHLFNVEKESSEMIIHLPVEEIYSSFHRCTANGKSLILCYSHPGAAIEQWESNVRTKRWAAPSSCKEYQHIGCIRASSDKLGISIGDEENKWQFEVRSLDNGPAQRCFSLKKPCYRFIPFDTHIWLIIPYYDKKQRILAIDADQQSLRTIQLQNTSETHQEENSEPFVWNLTSIPGEAGKLLVQYGDFFCSFNLNLN